MRITCLLLQQQPQPQRSYQPWGCYLRRWDPSSLRKVVLRRSFSYKYLGEGHIIWMRSCTHYTRKSIKSQASSNNFESSFYQLGNNFLSFSKHLLKSWILQSLTFTILLKYLDLKSSSNVMILSAIITPLYYTKISLYYIFEQLQIKLLFSSCPIIFKQLNKINVL